MNIIWLRHNITYITTNIVVIKVASFTTKTGCAVTKAFLYQVILSRLEIVLPLLKVLLKRRRSDEKKWISTVPSIGPREKKIFFYFF